MLMKSVSGIRGIVGESFDPELVVRVAVAFARYCKSGTIVLGRDSRPTGAAISSCVASVLMMSGCDVVELGIVPTPTVQVMVEALEAAGGMVISASHNPAQWNAFKLINSTGTFLNEREIRRFFSFMEQKQKYAAWNRFGTSRAVDAEDIHIKKVLKALDVPAIRKKRFKVVLDSVNGAGSVITQKLLDKLGCSVIPLYCEPDGDFPRGAEPLPENLKDLSAVVVRHNADIGFAQDPDADRLAIVDETGTPLGEEYTISLVTEHLLSIKKGPVVINLSTTKAVEDISHKYGVRCTRSKVGEINVVDAMRRGSTRIGGEGNGGVISPEIHLGRDSLAGIGYILEMMAQRKQKISVLKASLPQYTMIKGKVTLKPNIDTREVLLAVKNQYLNEKISEKDGIRIDFRKNGQFAGGWVHLRASNTEPIFRIIAEGETSKQAKLIYRHFAEYFKNT